MSFRLVLQDPECEKLLLSNVPDHSTQHPRFQLLHFLVLFLEQKLSDRTYQLSPTRANFIRNQVS